MPANEQAGLSSLIRSGRHRLDSPSVEHFLVVGDELSLPFDLLKQGRSKLSGMTLFAFVCGWLLLERIRVVNPASNGLSAARRSRVALVADAAT
ncbi:MAG: hypothetical protein C5B58_08350 [Acidobacteria bacterium]|nr:MAG: hypothetical protein C5B58_08350 [Acidobacteriota bacterium]